MQIEIRSFLLSAALAALPACGLFQPEGPAVVSLRFPKQVTRQTTGLRSAAEGQPIREWYRVTVNASDMAPQEVTGETGAVVEMEVAAGTGRVFSAEIFSDGNLNTKTHAGKSAPLTLALGERVSVVVEVRNIAANHPPVLTGAAIAEGSYDETTEIKVTPTGWSDADGDTPDYKYEWLVNGAVANVAGDTITGNDFGRGDKVACRVTPTDGLADGEPVTSNEITIVNAVPAIQSITFTAGSYITTSNITVAASASDADGDALTYAYKWYVDNAYAGAGIATATFPGGLAERGQSVKVEVTAYDGTVTGAAFMSAAKIIANAPPAVLSASLDNTAPTEIQTVNGIPGTATDLDNDEITFSYIWYVNNTPVGVTGPTLSGLDFSHFDTIYAIVTPHDGFVFGMAVSTSAVAVVKNTAPTALSVSITPGGLLNRALTATASGFGYADIDPDDAAAFYDYTWFVNGSPVTNGTQLSPTLFARGDNIVVKARPYDGFLYGAQVTSSASSVTNAVPSVSLSWDVFPLFTTTNAQVTPVLFDADGDTVSISYAWTVNGFPAGDTSSVLSSSYFARGDTVSVSATPNDGFTGGLMHNLQTTVLNAPPIAPAVSLSPYQMTAGTVVLTVTLDVNAFDADLDALSYTYDWYKNGVLVNSSVDNTYSTSTVKGDEWMARVRATDGTAYSEYVLTNEVRTVSQAKKVAVGFISACAITESDNLECWGKSYLGNGSATDQSTVPVAVSGFAGDVSSVSMGYDNTCVVKKNGTLWCWGSNYPGSLGVGDANERLVPTEVTALTGVVEVSVGMQHTCARLVDGSIYCFGSNSYFQLGTTGGARTLPFLVPLGGQAISVSAGNNHSCAVLSGGTVKCWGLNSFPQYSLGTGLTTTYISTPTLVVGISNAVKVVIGEEHTCALTSYPDVMCWGGNSFGQLGNATLTHSNGAVNTASLGGSAIDIIAGYRHTCALTSVNNMKCWGENKNGSLGNNLATDASAPTSANFGAYAHDPVSMGAGGGSTCAVLQNGGLTCFGYNFGGKLGNGAEVRVAAPISTIFSATQIAMGGQTFCLLSTQTWCWGFSGTYASIMGTGVLSRDNEWEPVIAAGGVTTVTKLAIGSGHMCALRSDNSVWCSGSNGQQEIGNAGAVNYAPVPYPALPATSATDIAVGYGFSCAILADTSTTCWGALSSGSGLTNAVQITAGGGHGCAVTTSGALSCWGDNTTGQIGDNTTFNRTNPVQIFASGISSVTAGYDFTCAVKTNNQVWCWGSQLDGRLGNGQSAGMSLVPVQVPGLFAMKVSTGNGHACALITAGNVFCWGLNDKYQVGHKLAGYSASPTGPVVSDASQIVTGIDSSCAYLSGTSEIKCWGNNEAGQLHDTSTWLPNAVLGYLFNPWIPM